MKYSINGEPRIGLAMSLYTIIILIMMAIFTLIICNTIKDSKTNDETIQNCIEENEMLWTYVENVDTCTSLEDAIARRDSMLYQMQFLDE